MARVSLTRVVLHNFGPFSGEHVFALSPSGLFSIKGKNWDTGGESGAGKSYVLHAIAYAMGHAVLSAKEMQCWATEDPMKVEVHMDTVEGPAILTRGSKLSLTVNGKKFEGSAAAVEAELDRITGVNAKLRAALTYRGQKKPGLFLSMTDAKKKEFFIEVLGLHWAEKAIEESEEKLSQLKKEVEREETKVESAKQSVAYSQASLVKFEIADLAEPVEAVNRAKANLAVLSAQVAEATKRRKEVEESKRAEAEQARNQFAGEIAQLENQLAAKRAEFKNTTYDTTEQERLTAKIVECRKRKDALQWTESQREEGYNHETRLIRDQLDEVNREIVVAQGIKKERQQTTAALLLLEQQKCQTCSRPWDGAQAEYETKRRQLEELDSLIAAAQLLSGKVSELKERIAARKFVPDPMIKKYDDYERHLSEKLASEKQKLAGTKALVEAETRAAVAGLKQQIADLQRQGTEAASAILQGLDSGVYAEEERRLLHELNESRLAVRSAEEELRRAQAQNDTNWVIAETSKKSLDRALAVLAENEEQLRQQRYLFNAESDFLSMLKGFLNAIFDEILEEISDESNAALARLPNVAHLTIRFESDYQTQKKTTKQQITPVVQFNGQQRPLSGCSGGMETSVELAVDFAVARVVGRRKNVELAWHMLDESFTGQDQVTKEGCLEVLQQYAADRLVLIIDHGSEMKEAFTRTIEIEHQNGLSRIAA